MAYFRLGLLSAIALVLSACGGAVVDAGEAAGVSDQPDALANTPDEDGSDGASDDEADLASDLDPDTAADPADVELAEAGTETVQPAVTDESTTASTGVVAAGETPPTTAGSTATSTSVAVATTAAPLASDPAPVATPDGFLPPGSALPSDAECAARVNPAAAVRAGNVTANAKSGGPNLSGPEFGRVSGNMTGTTDEILQWAACKWGLPADVARAQAATETWWRQGFLGDWTTTAADCAPGHAIGTDDKAGECPQSIGLLQIKYKFFKEAFPAAENSTAYSVDYAYAVWRNCFEGRQGWLNDSPKGQQYSAGDPWGCIGRWFAGEWYTAPATNYIAEVEERLTGRIWETAEFISHG